MSSKKIIILLFILFLLYVCLKKNNIIENFNNKYNGYYINHPDATKRHNKLQKQLNEHIDKREVSLD